MSRNRILAAGALLWAVAIGDVLVHAFSGDWMASVLWGAGAVVGVVIISQRRGRRSLSEDA